ncbi:MAG: FliA/WhiG family RNA polymerase sigma factor [Firmicutes bacterium]|uniref:FliA/WhiG family RNA polymerase sigma factor n=1 Tax=Candidatus Scybalomonas excrementavium TaxID=2840943 RepID=A0A9D9I0P0_9FIRM|nr:FliA/WhiG family RNA polymerase sigma factor [Candidatus Scybalomonas excrementavium]
MCVSNSLEDLTNEQLLIEYKQSGNIQLKHVLVLRYIYVIRSIALQMRGIYLNFAQIDDIINEGVICLMSSLDKFELEKGVKFETYITKRIRGMIIDLARKQDWVPRSVRKMGKEIEKVTTELHNELGRVPTDEEIANRYGISLEKYEEFVSKSTLFNVLSLDFVLEETYEKKKYLQVMDEEETNQPEEYYLDQELKEYLAQGIEQLREKEKMVISLYYLEELQMKEIAKVLEVSEPRVSQIHAKAISRLKEHMKKFVEYKK